MAVAMGACIARPTAVVARSTSQRVSRRSLTVVRATAEQKQASLVRPHPKLATPAGPGLGDAMLFNGPAPEIINGRLAMLGFLAAFGAELFTGSTVTQQWASAPKPVFITFLLFSLASLVPILRGIKNDEAFGPFTPAAELVNGRAAMVGFGSLLLVEAFKGSALF